MQLSIVYNLSCGREFEYFGVVPEPKRPSCLVFLIQGRHLRRGACHRARIRATRWLVRATCYLPVCLTGKSVKLAIEVNWLSSPLAKNIPLSPSGKSSLQARPSRPTEGRLAIVTDAGRDAVDADGA
jgi:hypothetical protein